MRIAVIGDSISTRSNGAAAHSWPELLDSMIRSMGVFDVEVRNYSYPGLTWKTAAASTCMQGRHSPLDGVKHDRCDLLLVCMGVNDRNNAAALADAMDFKRRLPNCRVIWIRQNIAGAASVVTDDEQHRMDNVCDLIGGEQAAVNLGALYAMGYTYDGLHPTDSGKQWIASAVYMYLQQHFQLSPIVRNIAWLMQQDSAVREAMRKVQT